MYCKRLLAIGAFTLMTSSAMAQSNVQVFGLLDVMAGRRELAGKTPVNQVQGGGLTTSFWGLRGSERLGGGLTAEFELTSFFRPDTGANGRTDADPLFTRSSWMGLRGAWGSLRLGRQSTLGFSNMLRFSAFGASSNFSPSFLHNYQSSATQPLMTGSGAADSAWNDVLSYLSPSVGGVTGAVFIAQADAPATVGNRRGANLSFTRGPLALGATVEKISGMSLNYSIPPAVVRMQESRVWNVGASYDFKVVKVFAQAISTELRNVATRIEIDTLNIGASVPLGAGVFLLSHGQARKHQVRVADVTRRTTSLAYDHRLSRRTDLYAVMMHDAATGLRSGRSFAVGMRHRF